MVPSIRKFFKSISLWGLFSMSLLGLFSLFPLLPISAQDIADQHPLPDSIGSKMKYNASIEMKKGYLSGICMLIRIRTATREAFSMNLESLFSTLPTSRSQER